MVLVLLRVRNARSTRRKLDIAPVHSIEFVRLPPFGALAEHTVAVSQLAGQDIYYRSA